MPRTKRNDVSRATRSSTLVNRRTLPGVQEREELNRLLRAHDPEVAAANRAEITAKYAPLLRQIALEAPHAGGVPGVRQQAIAWLGRFAAPDDLNALVNLAQFDLDSAVRGAALLSLGTSGVQLATPVLAAALSSRDPLEATAAEKALRALADRVGVDPLIASMSSARDPGLLRLTKKALEGRGSKPKKRKRSSVRAD